MVVNLNEIQFVLLDFFTRSFTDGNIKNTTRSTRRFPVVKCYTEVGVCSKAEDVFRAQPTRLFLHGYTIVNEQLELWLFSRLGICRSGFLRPGELTIQQLSAYYSKMTDVQFGLNPLIRKDESGHEYVLVKGLNKPESCLSDFPRAYKIRLDNDPIICPREIVGNRPTCYRATDDRGYEFAVKFSPNGAQSHHEARLLRRITERKIWGVAQLIDFRTVQVGTITSSCIVTCPFARDLEDYHSTVELMQCFRDAIKGHYYLYRDGKILHGDISLGNIMITNSYRGNPSAPCGILIDLDRSLDLETEPKKPHGLQGTKAFMAIDVSRPYDDHILHTYRHDLESFFYVFLYLAVCRNKRLPKTSRLTRWMDAKKDWVEVGRIKREDMSDNGNFAAIIDEFQPSFKDLGLLAHDLRLILFFSGKDFFVGTKTEAGDVDNIYHEVIRAFARWAERLDMSNVRW